MRRKDKEITDPKRITEIIAHCQVCRLGLAKDNLPYIVPVSFGYDGQAIYFHTAREGTKIAYIEANNAVCFEFERDVRILVDRHSPCSWTFSFQSVIGYGEIHELVGPAEKAQGLACIVAQYAEREWVFEERDLGDVRVWKIAIERLTGKESKDRRGATPIG